MISRHTREKSLLLVGFPSSDKEFRATKVDNSRTIIVQSLRPNYPELLRDSHNSSCPRAGIGVHSVETGAFVVRSQGTHASQSVSSLRCHPHTTIPSKRTETVLPVNQTSLFMAAVPRIQGVFS